MVCCIANCALWMATLSSAFFAVVINSACGSDRECQLLVGLYGKNLMRVPMLLFVAGCVLLFLEFVLFFKINVDAGFKCSLCLASCLILAPLFFHSMHKMGWAAAVVRGHTSAEERRAVPLTAAEVRACFDAYVSSQGPNVLAWDCDEFVSGLVHCKRHAKVTSTLKKMACQLFEAHVSDELASMASQEFANRRAASPATSTIVSSRLQVEVAPHSPAPGQAPGPSPGKDAAPH